MVVGNPRYIDDFIVRMQTWRHYVSAKVHSIFDFMDSGKFPDLQICGQSDVIKGHILNSGNC